MSGGAFHRDAGGRSPLQQEQVERTRQRILDGLVRVLARGLAGLSVPAVARESGVSVPTVYRYFKSKEELLRGLAEEYEARLGSSLLPPPPSDIDALGSYLRVLFATYQDMEPALRAITATAAGGPAPQTKMLQRLRIIEDWLDTVAPEISDEDHLRLRDLVAVLFDWNSQRAFKEYLGLSPSEAADTVSWAIRHLVGVARGGPTK